MDTAAPRWRPRPLELLLALAVGGLGVAEVVVPFASRQGTGSVSACAVGVGLVGTSLLWSRRQPQVPLAVFAVVWVALPLVGPAFILFYGGLLPLLVVSFMAVRFGRGHTPALGVATAVVFYTGILVFAPSMRTAGELLFGSTVISLVLLAAGGLRRHERRARESMRRAVEAEVGAAEQAMLAVVAERARIARELHDVVAHAVTSMVVQAGAAEQAGDDSDFVASALRAIRHTGNDALDEMRRLVVMLREDDDVPLTPQPRLHALPDLIAEMSTHGPVTRLEVAGQQRELPVGLDLTVYRLVQEALTNVRRHSGANECVVRLGYGAAEVRLEVVDDGRGGRADEAGGGHGLVGMRERVGLYGGSLEAGPEPGRGFAVRAVLPVTT